MRDARDASNLDQWYVNLQGQGPGSVSPFAHHVEPPQPGHVRRGVERAQRSRLPAVLGGEVEAIGIDPADVDD